MPLLAVSAAYVEPHNRRWRICTPFVSCHSGRLRQKIYVVICHARLSAKGRQWRVNGGRERAIFDPGQFNAWSVCRFPPAAIS